MILVDSNILIDIIERDPHWHDWSCARLAEASQAGQVIINHVILAEVAPFCGPLPAVVELLELMLIEIVPLSNTAAYAGGLAFKQYCQRRDRAAPKAILSDFLIGGHADVLGAAILTRDPRFYRTYFPSVSLITPD